MNTNVKYLLFGIMVLAQIGAPISLIFSRESILREGESITVSVDDHWEYGQIAYVILQKGDDGFAKAVKLTRNRPKEGIYLKILIGTVFYQSNGYPYEVGIEYPFGQYFLSEKKAPKAESLYREHTSSEKHEAYVVVRVRDGLAALENLFIAGKPISDFFR
jgi:hypothetical protein